MASAEIEAVIRRFPERQSRILELTRPIKATAFSVRNKASPKALDIALPNRSWRSPQ
jgi:hypothetical protein